MLNSRELRIGNWVKGEDPGGRRGNEPFQVENIYENNINLYHVPGFSDEWATNVEGIPLTSAILEACGFEKNMGGYYFERVFKDPKDGFCLEMEFDDPSDGRKAHAMEVAAGKGGGLIPSPLDHVKYLHQLQNLIFCLTGKELEISLPLKP